MINNFSLSKTQDKQLIVNQLTPPLLFINTSKIQILSKSQLLMN